MPERARWDRALQERVEMSITFFRTAETNFKKRARQQKERAREEKARREETWREKTNMAGENMAGEYWAEEHVEGERA